MNIGYLPIGKSMMQQSLISHRENFVPKLAIKYVGEIPAYEICWTKEDYKNTLELA